MANFRFQDEAVDAQIISDIASLNAMPTPLLSNFFSAGMDFIVGGDSQALLTAIQGVAEEAGANQSALKNALRSTLIFLKGAAKKALTPALFAEDLGRFGFDEDKVGAVTPLWRARLANIGRTGVDSTFLINKLVDIEWRFGATAGSSEVEEVGRTYLQLKLVLDKGEGLTESVNMEMSLPQFYQFLQEMEKAKASLDVLS